jgi:hypothetical protein
MNFPKYFSSLNEHMMLVPSDSESCFQLVPPNQNDWHFTLIKFGNNRWVVHGKKEPDFNSDVTKTMTVYRYISKKNSWVCMS